MGVIQINKDEYIEIITGKDYVTIVVHADKERKKIIRDQLISIFKDDARKIKGLDAL